MQGLAELASNIFKKCLRNEWRRLLFSALKIVLGEQQPVVTLVAAGCIFLVWTKGELRWIASRSPTMAPELC